MDHASRVGVGDGLTDREEDLQEPLLVVARVTAALEECRERVALDELHREERALVRLQAELVHGDDPRVLELSADLRLLDEALDHGAVVLEALVQHLDRDVAAEVLVAALHHDAQAAARDLAEHVVAGADGCGTRRADRLHDGIPVGRGVREREAQGRAHSPLEISEHGDAPRSTEACAQAVVQGTERVFEISVVPHQGRLQEASPGSESLCGSSSSTAASSSRASRIRGPKDESTRCAPKTTRPSPARGGPSSGSPA